MSNSKGECHSLTLGVSLQEAGSSVLARRLCVPPEKKSSSTTLASWLFSVEFRLERIAVMLAHPGLQGQTSARARTARSAAHKTEQSDLLCAIIHHKKRVCKPFSPLHPWLSGSVGLEAQVERLPRILSKAFLKDLSLYWSDSSLLHSTTVEGEMLVSRANKNHSPLTNVDQVSHLQQLISEHQRNHRLYHRHSSWDDARVVTAARE